MKIKKLSLLIIILIMISLVAIILAVFNVTKTVETKAIPKVVTYEINKKSESKTETVSIEIESSFDIATQEMNAKIKGIEIIGDKKEWFIAYKSIMDEYRNILDLPETIYDCLSEEEIYLIQRVVETECYGGDFKSKVNVANVIFNRLDSGRFGETIEEIITSPNQFAYMKEHITQDSVLAVEFAFTLEDTTDGALFFHSNKRTNTFNGANFIFCDDIGHCFYK